MELIPLFSIGVGKTKEIDLLKTARQLFLNNKNFLKEGEGGIRTTLQRYNSNTDTVELNNKEAVHLLKHAIEKNAIKLQVTRAILLI
jgi:hypothetical protein